MPALANLVRVASSTTGTGTLTLGAAISGFLNPTQAGMIDGVVYSYAIEADYIAIGDDMVPTSREVGVGTYSSGAGTLTRTTIYNSTNSNNALSLAGDEQVIIAGNKNTVRELLTGSRTYYVRSDGSDSNNGLANSSGGAFLTIQKAMDTITNTLDVGGQDVIIQWASASTYSAAGYGLVSNGWVGGGRIFLDMNSQTLSAVNSCVFLNQPSQGSFFVQNAVLTSTNISAIHINTSQIVFLNGGITFGACSSNAHILCGTAGATFSSSSTAYTISGNAIYHARLLHAAAIVQLTSSAITFSGSPTITTFIEANPGYIDTQACTFTSSPAAGCKKYNIDVGGVIRSGGVTLPGTVAGTGGTTTGGGYFL